jgi:hypothetical protein
MNKKRKLTWIEKKQIEKMAFDHPFFDIPGTVLSKKEAKAIIRSAEARKSGAEIVAEACDKAGVSRPDSVDNHYSVFDNLKEVFAVPAIRRIGIIAIALILLVAFFATTPIGRSIAESVIQYLVTLLSDGSITVSQNDNKEPLVVIPNTDETNQYELVDGQIEPICIDSFDDFIKATGKTPVILPLPYVDLYYEYDITIDYIALYSTYETQIGQIVTYQIWDVVDAYSFTLTGYMPYAADQSIYYSNEEETGYLYCKMIMDDSLFSLSSKGSYTIDDIVAMLRIEKNERTP